MAEKINKAELNEDAFDLAFEAAASTEETSTEETSTEETSTEETSTEETSTEETSTEETSTEETSTEETSTEETSTEKAPEPTIAEAAAKAAGEAVAAAAKVKADAKAKADAEAKAVADAKVLTDAAKAKETPSEDEQATLDDADTNFPEVAKAAAIREKLLIAKIDNLFTAKMAELAGKIEQRIAPTEEAVGQTARNAHESAILGVHKDAFTILPNMEVWIDTQPAFLKASYNDVLDKGDSSAVVDLITIYKTATGTEQSAGPTAEEVAEAAADKAANKVKADAKKKKIEAQEGVRGRQTSQKSGIDEDDFESAFELAASN